MIFVSSEKGIVKAVNIVPQKMAYVYLDLGKREYCTISMENKNLRRKKGHNNLSEN